MAAIPRPRPPGDLPYNPSLIQAKAWLRQRIRDGEKCPCCNQYVKIYKRSIHHTIAHSLIQLYRISAMTPDGWVHVPTMLRGTGERGEVGKARYWGLVEEATEKRDDGGRAGYWRLTDIGRKFVENRWVVKRHALVFDSRCLGFEGDHISITDALGDKFDYQELMNK